MPMIPSNNKSRNVQQQQRQRRRRRRGKSCLGKGLLNTVIDKLPFPLHFPGGYKYLGPGTPLEDHLEKNIQPKNKLDEAAKEHDIAYSKYSDLKNRHIADKILEHKAWDRVKSSDAKFSEKLPAYLTVLGMKAKRKLGAGIKKSSYKHKRKNRHRASPRRQKLKGQGISFNQLVSKARRAIRGNNRNKNIGELVSKSLSAVKKIKVKTNRKKRIIRIPKTGGFIPLIPILTALSHVGSLVGGVKSIVNAVKSIKSVRDNYKAQQGSGIIRPYSIGEGLIIQPHKKGYGLSVTT